MGLFWSSTKPSVSRSEFKEDVLRYIAGKGWNEADRDKVKMVFEGHLFESGSDEGIDKSEIEDGIKTLKRTSDISDERLKDLGRYMMKLAR